MLELSYVVYACIMNNTMWKLETYIYCKLDIHCLIYVYIYIYYCYYYNYYYYYCCYFYIPSSGNVLEEGVQLRVGDWLA